MKKKKARGLSVGRRHLGHCRHSFPFLFMYLFAAGVVVPLVVDFVDVDVVFAVAVVTAVYVVML